MERHGESLSAQPPNPELQEALIELQQYLSDAVAPLIVADSVQLLMKYPPDVVANAIRAWTGAQYRRGSAAAVPVSDYLFHTLKKIHMMAEFRLVPREPLEVYLSGLRPLILQLCPAEDRAMLIENLGRLGEAPASISQAQNIFRQAPTEGSGPRTSASRRGRRLRLPVRLGADAGRHDASLFSRAGAPGGAGGPREAFRGDGGTGGRARLGTARRRNRPSRSRRDRGPGLRGAQRAFGQGARGSPRAAQGHGSRGRERTAFSGRCRRPSRDG